jgi:Dolichyl-phosphate-mannose-protein mannosyltransferase
MRVSEAHATQAAGSGRAARPRRQSPLGDRASGSEAVSATVVIALAGLGVALRVAVAGQSVFADELSTYWIVSTNGFEGVLSTVHSDAEISPPLYFVAAWLTTRIDLTPELLRAPSLLAGVATIPLTYVLGLRTEARGYALMVLLVLLSTLALLAAVDDRRTRWWVAYGVCSCAAVYTHYTSVFALGVQLLWLIWAHPEARKAALLANAGAIAAFLPWLSGLRADFNSPTADILDALSPFNTRTVRISLTHWSVGHPFAFPRTGLRDLPGAAPLLLFGLGVALAAVAAAVARLREQSRSWIRHLDCRVVLILALALSVPIGQALWGVVGTNLFGTRNLAASWPAFALTLAALLVAAGPRLRFAAAALVIGCFAIGAARMLEPRFERPDSQAVASFIDRNATAGDIVLDGAVFGISPGPLSGLDVAFDRPHRVLRVGAPDERDHPFGASDRILPPAEVTRRAVAAARGRRIFLVSGESVFLPTSLPARDSGADQVAAALPDRYRRIERRTYPGILSLAVSVYADRSLRANAR